MRGAAAVYNYTDIMDRGPEWGRCWRWGVGGGGGCSGSESLGSNVRRFVVLILMFYALVIKFKHSKV